MTTGSFRGAKLAVLSGGAVLTLLRDDRPDIPFPSHWDLPGGGREGSESPLACALRETGEELGLVLPPRAVGWGRRFDAPGPGASWFFVAELPRLDPGTIVLGDEGQGWALMPLARFLSEPRAVPHFATRLRFYLAQRGRR